MNIIRTALLRALLPALCLFVVLPSHAGLIVVSADANILNPVDGSGGVAVNAGNQQFLSNVLGLGTTTLVHDNCSGCAGSLTTAISAVNNYYNGLTGVSSSTLAGPITAASLAGIDLFVSILPATLYSASELSALSSFGGSILFLGDNSAFQTQNGNINAALAALGSSISIIPNTLFDAGFHTATGSQIASDPLTAGISSLVYAAPSELLVAGGTALFFGTGGQAFIAYDGVIAVPEPSGLALLILGLAVLTVTWRRRRADVVRF